MQPTVLSSDSQIMASLFLKLGYKGPLGDQISQFRAANGVAAHGDMEAKAGDATFDALRSKMIDLRQTSEAAPALNEGERRLLGIDGSVSADPRISSDQTVVQGHSAAATKARLDAQLSSNQVGARVTSFLDQKTPVPGKSSSDYVRPGEPASKWVHDSMLRALGSDSVPADVKADFTKTVKYYQEKRGLLLEGQKSPDGKAGPQTLRSLHRDLQGLDQGRITDGVTQRFVGHQPAVRDGSGTAPAPGPVTADVAAARAVTAPATQLDRDLLSLINDPSAVAALTGGPAPLAETGEDGTARAIMTGAAVGTSVGVKKNGLEALAAKALEERRAARATTGAAAKPPAGVSAEVKDAAWRKAINDELAKETVFKQKGLELRPGETKAQFLARVQEAGVGDRGAINRAFQAGDKAVDALVANPPKVADNRDAVWRKAINEDLQKESVFKQKGLELRPGETKAQFLARAQEAGVGDRGAINRAFQAGDQAVERMAANPQAAEAKVAEAKVETRDSARLKAVNQHLEGEKLFAEKGLALKPGESKADFIKRVEQAGVADRPAIDRAFSAGDEAAERIQPPKPGERAAGAQAEPANGTPKKAHVESKGGKLIKTEGELAAEAQRAAAKTAAGGAKNVVVMADGTPAPSPRAGVQVARATRGAVQTTSDAAKSAAESLAESAKAAGDAAKSAGSAALESAAAWAPTVAKWAGRAGAVGAVVDGGVSVYKDIQNGEVKETPRAVGRFAGAIAGAKLGAAGGALAFSWTGPGAVIAGVVGAIGGGIVGAYAGDKVVTSIQDSANTAAPLGQISDVPAA